MPSWLSGRSGTCRWPSPAHANEADWSHSLPIARRRGFDEQLADHARGRHTIEFGLGVQHETVGENGLGESLDVVGDHVVASSSRGESLRGSNEGKGTSY